MRSAAVCFGLVLVASGMIGCEVGPATTTPAEGAAAQDAAIADVRSELAWLQLSDGEIVSAMLAFCGEGSLEEAMLAPQTWLIEWAFSRTNAVLAETDDSRTEAFVTNMRSAGFGDAEDDLDQLQAFDIAIGISARPLCPDKWDRFFNG